MGAAMEGRGAPGRAGYARAELLDALNTIPPDLPRDAWVRAGMAAKAAGLTLTDFTEWSRGAGNFASERDCATTWKSFSAEGKVGAGTLITMAREAGWTAPEKPKAERKRKGPKEAPDTLWARCQPATVEHGYLVRKGCPAVGLRVVPATDPLIVAGKSVAGWLAVPAYGQGGALRTLQLISPEGEKLSMPGASFADGYHLVGDANTPGAVFVAEGFATAYACHQATGRPAVVTFGSGRTRTVLDALKSHHPHLTPYWVPDKGVEDDALAAGRGLRMARMPADKQRNYDASDYLAEHGVDALRKLLTNATVPGLAPPSTRTALDILQADLPPAVEFAPARMPSGMVVLAGPPKARKSWLALQAALAAACGTEFLGVPCRTGPVLLLALEDNDRRMQTRMQVLGVKPCEGLKQLDVRYSLAAPGAGDIAEWLSTHPDASLVVVDVLQRLRAPTDGRRPQYEADYACMAELHRLVVDRPGLTLLVIHHTRKSEALQPIEAIAGSFGVSGAADGIAVLKPTEEHSAEFYVTGRDWAHWDNTFSLQWTPAGWEWGGVSDGLASLPPGLRSTLETLRAAGNTTPSDLARARGIAKQSAREALHALVDRGLAYQKGAEFFALDAPGAPRAAAPWGAP